MKHVKKKGKYTYEGDSLELISGFRDVRSRCFSVQEQLVHLSDVFDLDLGPARNASQNGRRRQELQRVPIWKDVTLAYIQLTMRYSDAP